MKKKVVNYLVLLLLICLSGLYPTSVYAGEVLKEPVIYKNSVMPRSDFIQIKYRTYNGIKQYRRWNVTKKCWVDPYWINL